MNSFQEVLEAVLFGGWSIPPSEHDVHFICGKDIDRIDVYIEQCVSLVFLFWGEVGKFRPSRSSRVSGSARRNLSPTRQNYLGTAVRALRA